MGKGNGNGVFMLHYPFNEQYFNRHINSKTHQSNSLNNEYIEEMINNRKLKRKKQSGMTNFLPPKRNLISKMKMMTFQRQLFLTMVMSAECKSSGCLQTHLYLLLIMIISSNMQMAGHIISVLEYTTVWLGL